MKRTSINLAEEHNALQNYEEYIRNHNSQIRQLHPQKEVARFHEDVALIVQELSFTHHEIHRIFNNKFVILHSSPKSSFAPSPSQKIMLQRPQPKSSANSINQNNRSATNSSRSDLRRDNSYSNTNNKLKTRELVVNQLESFSQLIKLFCQLNQNSSQKTTAHQNDSSPAAQTFVIKSVMQLALQLGFRTGDITEYLVCSVQCRNYAVRLKLPEMHSFFLRKYPQLALSDSTNKVSSPAKLFVQARVLTAIIVCELLIRYPVVDLEVKLLQLISMRVDTLALSSGVDRFAANTAYLCSLCSTRHLAKGDSLAALHALSLLQTECLPAMAKQPQKYAEWTQKLEQLKQKVAQVTLSTLVKEVNQDEQLAQQKHRSKTRVLSRASKNSGSLTKEKSLSQTRLKLFSGSTGTSLDKRDESKKWRLDKKPPTKQLFIDPSKPFYSKLKKVKAPKDANRLIYEQLRNRNKKILNTNMLEQELADAGNLKSNSLLQEVPEQRARMQQSKGAQARQDLKNYQEDEEMGQNIRTENPNILRFLFENNRKYHVVKVHTILKPDTLTFFVQGPDYRLVKKLLRIKQEEPKDRLTPWPLTRILVKKWLKRERDLREIQRHFAFLDIDINNRLCRRRLGLKHISQQELSEIVEVKETVKLFLRFALATIRKENGSCKSWQKRFSFQGLRTVAELVTVVSKVPAPIHDATLFKRVKAIMAGPDAQRLLIEYIHRRQDILYLVQIYYSPRSIEKQLQLINNYVELMSFPLTVKCQPFLPSDIPQKPFVPQPLLLNFRHCQHGLSRREAFRMVVFDFCQCYRLASHTVWLLSQVKKRVKVQFENQLKLVVGQHTKGKSDMYDFGQPLHLIHGKKDFLEQQRQLVISSPDIFDQLSKINQNERPIKTISTLSPFRHQDSITTLVQTPGESPAIAYKCLVTQNLTFYKLKKLNVCLQKFPKNALQLFRSAQENELDKTELNLEYVSGLLHMVNKRLKTMVQFQDRWYNLSVTVLRTRLKEPSSTTNNQRNSTVAEPKFVVQYQIVSKYNDCRTYKLILNSNYTNILFSKLPPNSNLDTVAVTALSLSKFLRLVRSSIYSKLCFLYEPAQKGRHGVSPLLHNQSQKCIGSSPDALRNSSMSYEDQSKSVFLSRTLKVDGEFVVLTVGGSTQHLGSCFNIELFLPRKQHIYSSRICLCRRYDCTTQQWGSILISPDPQAKSCFTYLTAEEKAQVWRDVIARRDLMIGYDKSKKQNFLRVGRTVSPLVRVLHQQTGVIQGKKGLIQVQLLAGEDLTKPKWEKISEDEPEFRVQVWIMRNDSKMFVCELEAKSLIQSLRNEIVNYQRNTDSKPQKGRSGWARVNGVWITGTMLGSFVMAKFGSLVFRQCKKPSDENGNEEQDRQEWMFAIDLKR